jgi:hypothetical protein
VTGAHTFSGGAGGQGIIVITYTPAIPLIYTTLSAQCTAATNATSTLTVTCAKTTTYSCADAKTIVQTATSTNCSVAVNNNFKTCSDPGYCVAGDSYCYYSSAYFSPVGPQTGGGLTVRPNLVHKGGQVQIFWNVLQDSAQNCTVTGPGGPWSGYTSGATGVPSGAINQQSIFTISCLNDDMSTYSTKTATVNIVPTYQEK